jgi:capsular polysaccharide biosynthesis protein
MFGRSSTYQKSRKKPKPKPSADCNHLIGFGFGFLIGFLIGFFLYILGVRVGAMS